MNEQATVLHTRWAWWIIRRNPTYLLSAALMAVGARMYLVSPSTWAGDVGMILMTLGILQAYEWAVGAILLSLHRWGRSPEDKPSLLLVAALFWTGPMAATAEMTAQQVVPGMICAGLCCAIALGQLWIVRRAMGLKFSLIGRAAASACVVLLAIAPAVVRIPDTFTGGNESFLYATWWVLAALALAGVAAVRHHTHNDSWPAYQRDFGMELALLVMAIGATAAHLAGMNYAYFGHAQWFYGSPLIVAVAVVLMEFVASTDGLRFRPTSTMLLSLAIFLPVAAIAPAFQHFDEHVPLSTLPMFLRDPLLSTLVIAAAAWWFGFWRLRVPIMLHAGSAALAWAVFRALHLPAFSPAIPSVTPDAVDTRNIIVLGMYALAAYLVAVAIARRARAEVVAAIVVHQLALTLLVWNRTPADAMIVWLSAGWCWMAALAIVGRPSLRALAMPIVLLLLVTWGYDWNPDLCWHARSHAVAMLLIMLGLSLMWPDRHYGLLTVCAGAADALFFAGRWIGSLEHALATFVVIAAFALLVLGAIISWQKRSLIELMMPRIASSTRDDTSDV